MSEAPSSRREILLEQRLRILDEMEEADLDLSRLRMRLERWESDLRISQPPAPGYDELKGRIVPQAEARVVGLFRELTRVEDRIRLGDLRAAGQAAPSAAPVVDPGEDPASPDQA